MRAADYIVDVGPGAGCHGGQIVAAGTLEDILACPQSVTGQYLSGVKKIPVPTSRRPGNGNFLKIRGASENNLKDVDVDIPLGCFVCVTGVSGSGKSSLVNEVLNKTLLAKLNHARTRPLKDVDVDIPLGCFVCVTGVSGSGKSSLVNEVLNKTLLAKLNHARTRPGACRSVDGLEHLDKVIDIDQSPIGRTPRSNPATYTGLFNDIRDLFASTNDAKIRLHQRCQNPGLRPGPVQLQRQGRPVRSLLRRRPSEN